MMTPTATETPVVNETPTVNVTTPTITETPVVNETPTVNMTPTKRRCRTGRKNPETGIGCNPAPLSPPEWDAH